MVEHPNALITLIASEQQDRIKTDDQEEISMAIFNPLTVNSSVEQSHQLLSSEFMWFQLIIEILLRMTAQTLESGFKKLIIMCRKHYENNDSNLSIIKELEDTYNNKNAIWWYSRETFIFRMLNRALRRQDVDILVMFAFLIQDVYQQLKELQYRDSQVTYVYRGQLIPITEFERLKNSIGNYISINSFFSTSRSRRLAKSFAKTYNTDTTKTSVLFEIEADSSLFSAKPFADITRMSAFGDREQEVLFMLGSIFQIASIERSEDEKLWSVKFIISSDDESELKPTFESMKTRLDAETTGISLGNLFYEMGKPHTAELYYRKLLKVLSEDDRSLPRVYGGLGNVALSNYDYQSADLYYRKSLDLELQSPSKSEFTIASIYANLGITLRKQFKYEQALKYFKKSLELRGKICGYDHYEVAKIYEEIGRVYQDQKKYHLALENYNECLRIKTKVLPRNHLEVALSLATLGTLQEDIGDLESAISNYKTGLSIQLRCLPISPSTARMYENIGRCNEIKFLNESEALQNYEKALEILQHPSLAPDHPNIAVVLFRIGNIYAKRRDHDLSKIKYEEALSIQLASTPNHINIAATYNSIGALNLSTHQNYEEALVHFNKALSIYSNTLLPFDDTEIIRTQVNIAKTYYLMGKFDTAKCYLEKISKNLKENDPRIIEFDNQMGEIAYERQEYDTAYSYFKEALDKSLNSSDDQSSLIADIYKSLGAISMHKQLYDQAYEYLSKALDLKLKTVGYDDNSTANVYLQIGKLYMRQEQYDMGLLNYNKCLQIQNKILDGSNLEKANTLRNIGLAHHVKKNYELAMDNYNAALFIQTSSYSNHPETARTYIALAKLHFDAHSNVSEALSYYQKALIIYQTSVSLNNSSECIKLLNNIRSIYTFLATTAYQRKNYDNAYSHFVKALEYEQMKPTAFIDPCIIAELYKNIATISLIQENYDVALGTYYKALEFHLKTVGHDHLQTATIYGNIAYIQNLQGSYDEALTNSYECFNIRQKLLPNNHTDLAKALVHVGLIYKDMKNYDLTIINFKKALSIQLESIPNSLETAQTYNHIGCIYMDCIINYTEALFHLQEAFKLCESNHLPSNHPEVIRIQHNLGLIYTKLGNEAVRKKDYDSTIENYQKAIEFQQGSIHKNDALISKLYFFIGSALAQKHDHHCALMTYQKSLDIKLETIEKSDQFIADVYQNIAVAHYMLGNYETAIANLNQCLEIQRQLYGENHSNIAMTLTTVGAVYYKSKDYDLALTYYQHALKIRVECLPSDHLDTATSYKCIGELHEIGFENYIEALNNYEKALVIYRNLSLPSDDSELITALDSAKRVKEKMRSN